jgi:DNA invertase Pin-like site-specific DNA recombinase
MKKFLTYYRVSTDRQGETGLGIEAQRQAVARFLNGAAPIAEFVEVESGKRHKNRPRLLAALELCRKHRATLVIAKLDRLARNVHFVSGLLESGVEFVCCDNPHANKTHLQMNSVFAEWEREIISQRTREAMQRAKAYLAQHGQRLSLKGRVYTKLGNPRIEEARELALDLARQLRPAPQILALIVEARTRGESLRAIARALNAQNIRTPRGYRWYASTIRAALKLHDEITKERNERNTIGRNNEITNSTSRLPVTLNAATPVSVPSNAGREATETGGDMGSIDEAQRMLDIFTSVGARSFLLTKLDLLQQKIWAKPYTAAELRDTLPAIMRTAEIRKPIAVSEANVMLAGENVIIRPTGHGVTFVQLDDLSLDQIGRVTPASFAIIETSPRNYQAWIAVSPAPADKEAEKDLIRRVRKAVGEFDKSASGATRLAGTCNYKVKYGPDFPTITITHAAPGRLLTEKELSQMGLLAAPEPIKIPVAFAGTSSNIRPWPSYAICLERAPKKKDGTPDRSRADLNFAMTALTGGKQVEETIAKLTELSERVKERLRSDPGYARVTVENAAKFVSQNYGKSRSRA